MIQLHFIKITKKNVTLDNISMCSFEVLPFYRGISRVISSPHPYLSRPRTNRLPKNSPINFHSVADEWFFSRFGVRYRSNSVFLTSNLITANSYTPDTNNVVRVIPISKYRFCWSPKVSDLYWVATRLGSASSTHIQAELSSLGYIESDLCGAFLTGHELMLNCDQYIAIPNRLLNEKNNVNDNGGSIILEA